MPDELLQTPRLLRDEVVAALTSEAEGVDLLCLGSRGYGPVGRVLLGSQSSELIKDAPCPILMVPRGVAGGSKEQGEAANEGA